MLDQSLENFLETMCNPHQYKLYVDIIMYLESIEYDTIQDELLNIMYSSQDAEEAISKEDSTVSDEFYGHLRECCLTQLGVSGITVSEAVSVKDLHDLLIGLSNIATHEDAAGIISCCMLDEDSVHKLAEILQLVTSLSSDHWVTILDEVQPELIKMIQHSVNEQINDEYAEQEETAVFLDKMRTYAEYCVSLGHEHLKIFQFVQRVVLGHPFETYLKSGVLHDLLQGDEMDKLALEMYGMAIISGDASQDPVGSIRKIIENYLDDTRRIVMLNSEIELINAGFIKFYQTNKNVVLV